MIAGPAGRYWILLLLLLAIGWKTLYSPIASRTTTTVFSENMMTMDYRILIGDSLNSTKQKLVQKIIETTFAEINSIYNKWNPTSEVSQLNQLKAYQKKQLSPELFQFLQGVGALVELTGGRFDPTIEPLQQVWNIKLDSHEIPTMQELSLVQESIGWKHIFLDNGEFYKDNDHVCLDLGGVAKGFCVDLLIKRLNLEGFLNVFVEWGGEIRVSGKHPENRPWAIYISRFENNNPDEAIDRLNLEDQAIATSGNYLQYWKVKSSSGEIKTYSHIYNPHTLYPIEVTPQSIASASVVAPDCMSADALATAALLFNSVEEAQSWAVELNKSHPEWRFWIVSRDNFAQEV